MPLPELRLKVRVHGRHPWFFRKMIHKPAERLAAGAAVRVFDRDGKPVGIGFYNPRTELALRMLARTADGGTPPEAASDPQFDPLAELLRRLDLAIRRREELLQLPEVTNGYRLVHAEGDGISGLILDRLGDAVVAQVFAEAILARIEPIGEALQRRYPTAQLVLTVDDEAARREGMERPPRLRAQPTEVLEHGIRYGVVPGTGHKTGFFADQRDNRLLLGSLARGRRVLDLCCHAGGFAMHAVRGGARSVLAADLDEAAVALAAENAKRNRLRFELRHADAFDLLREVTPGAHDCIVLDPPKWAAGKGEVAAASRRYFDLNLLALQKLAPGGLLLTCSCSGALAEERFLALLAKAAAEAGRDARVLHLRGAGPDHPVALECPETRYLKCVLLQVD